MASLSWTRAHARTASCLCASVLIVQAQLASGQSQTTGAQEKFVRINGARIHYLDFGGQGLPLLFMHSGNLSATTFSGFAPRFTDGYRVIAMTERGVAPSEGERAGQVQRGRDALGLLDSLGIERAVVIGNSSPTAAMLYLAEHDPTRLAGLVFLANAPEPQLSGANDSLRVQEMGMRMVASMQGMDPERYIAQAESLAYQPEYLRTGGAIQVPALTFTSSTGDKGVEKLADVWLGVAMQAGRGALSIPDSVARAYFARLASDPQRQEEVRAYYRTTVAAAWRASEQAFYTAFGERIRVVRLDVPSISGYEYRDAPDLIYPHIRSFLDEITPSRR